MKELVILSGKGGTGKTSLVSAFASFAENMVLCDADVDASDLHLILNPEHTRSHDFESGNEAIIDPGKCSQCGRCIDLCRFDAIRENFTIDSVACEGCGVCVDLCPEQAVDFPKTVCGQWYLSKTRLGPMVHARLGIARENSGKLVSLVRQEAKKLAIHNEHDLILTDGPPGIGCPVVASLGRADAVLIVAEPTVSGIHDLKRVVELTRHFNVPAMVCINKFDLNPGQSEEIENIARRAGVADVGRISFDPLFTRAMVQKKTIFEYDSDSMACRQVKQVWNKIQALGLLNMTELKTNTIIGDNR